MELEKRGWMTGNWHAERSWRAVLQLPHRRPCLFSLSPSSRRLSLHSPPLLPSVLLRYIHSYLPRNNINCHSMSSGVPSPPAPANKIAEAALPTPVSSPPSASLSWPWQGMQSSFHDFLKSEVDPELSAIPLAAYCFMTGWMCAALTHLLSFHAIA